MKYQNIKKQISQVKKSPLFYLFLSSKELFHTNFWAWLFEINKAEAIKLFSASKHTDIKTPIREYNKSYNPTSENVIKGKQKDKSKDISSAIDLFIKTKEHEIVVENKVKDFPTVDQLDRIVESFGPNTKASFKLVSLFYTGNIKLPSAWKVMNYEDLSYKINPSNLVKGISEVAKIQYYESLIEDYKQFIFNLHSLAFDSELEVTNNYDFANDFHKDQGVDRGLFSLLDEIRFWEVYQKMRASHLKYEFEKFNKLSFIGPVVYGIHHQRATINFPVVLLLNEKDEKILEIGVQLENDEFRKYVYCKNAASLLDKMKNNDVFFDKNFISPNKKKYLSYGEKWKYQYKKIINQTDGKNIKYQSFKSLFKSINTELEVINNNKKNIIKWFHEVNK
jgi:hypothetical protein